MKHINITPEEWDNMSSVEQEKYIKDNNIKVECSIGIHDLPTKGFGELDDNGFWEYQCKLSITNSEDTLTIFEYLSMTVLPQDNKSNENILRTILFNNCNNIDWDNVKQVIEQEHPEMKGYNWNENCMYKLPYNPITKEPVAV